jgi:hypothetical protein
MNPIVSEDVNRTDEPIAHESTYAMLVRSEEKERTFLEVAIYFLFVLSVVAAIWQFAEQPIALPLDAVTTTADATPLLKTTALCASNTHG